MKFEITMPKFTMPELKGIRNPLTHQGVRALAIVLGVIVVIAGAVFAANFRKRSESSVLPATTRQEATNTPETAVPTEIPTVAPLTEEATSAAFPSSIRKVLRSTGTPTPAAEGVTVTTTPAL